MKQIFEAFPDIAFRPHVNFVWSPKDKSVYYDPKEVKTPTGALALLHEIGHAKLEHNTYNSDIELLNMEVDAWEFARVVAPDFDISIDEDHINTCVETYRIWLYKRSRCPECENHGLQRSPVLYQCFLCRHTWKVAQTLNLRPRRMRCF